MQAMRLQTGCSRPAGVPWRSAFAGARVPQVSHSGRAVPRRSARPARPAPLVVSAIASAPAADAQPAARPESKVDWFNTWFPIAFTRDVGNGPYAFTLLEQPIVVWKDSSGTYRCFRDACPHRLVPLSDGRIAPNGNLQCPYHGWEFSGCGTCRAMPQGGDPASPRAAATAYCCVEAQGLVWVKLQAAPADGSAPDTSGIQTMPEVDDPDWFLSGDTWRDIPYDWATLIENVVDAGHVPFTHHGSVSKRQSSGDYGDMTVTERGEWGFRGVWATGPRKGALGAQHTVFAGPVLMRHTIDAYDTNGFANITAVYGVPVAPGRCRAIVRQPFKFKGKLIPTLLKLMPEWRSHLGNNSVLDEDVIFLHMQERESALRGMGDKPPGQVYYMPAASDAYVSDFRTWLNNVAGGGPWGPMDRSYLAGAGPRQPEAQLLDRFHSHTEKCSICRPALRDLQLAAALPPAASKAAAGKAAQQAAQQAASAWGLPPLLALAAGAMAVALVAGLVWAWCRRTLPRFYSGVRPFARNRVPGEYAP